MKKVHLAVLVSVLVGCATSPEITAWNMAREVNTPAAYEDFVRRYPQSGNTDEARTLIEKAKTEKIKKASSVDECIQVMKTNPEAKTAAMVADVAFEAAKKETSIEALYGFLMNFKGHPGAPAVRSRLEQLEFESAGKDASPAAVEYFLYRYPESRFAGEGRELLAEKTYRQAKGWGNQYGYKAFLARFPENRHAAEIRGLSRTSVPQTGSSNVKMTLAEAVDKSPSLKKQGCVLTLSEAIRKNPGDVDSLRHQLYELEKGAASGSLPEACSSVNLKAKPGAEGSLAEALQALAMVEEQRKELAGKWEVYRQRDEMVKAAIVASSNVVNDLETAELSEEVLGSGPLGRLDIGSEKGSVPAKKALERFRGAQKLIQGNKDDIKRLLLETDGLYQPLQSYAIGFVEAK